MTNFFIRLRTALQLRRIAFGAVLFVLITIGARVCAAVRDVQDLRLPAQNVFGAIVETRKHTTVYSLRSPIHRATVLKRESPKNKDERFARFCYARGVRPSYGSLNGPSRDVSIGIYSPMPSSPISSWQRLGTESLGLGTRTISRPARGQNDCAADGKVWRNISVNT